MATFTIGDEGIVDFATHNIPYPDFDVEGQITALWLLAIELGHLKQSIVRDWRKIQKLEAEIRDRDGHPRIGIAHMRCDQLTYHFIFSCVRLQEAERRAQSLWVLLKPKDREMPTEVLGCPRTTASLLGGFNTYHKNIAVPDGFQWPESALHWVPPQQEDALVRNVGIDQALKRSFMWTRKDWDK